MTNEEIEFALDLYREVGEQEIKRSWQNRYTDTINKIIVQEDRSLSTIFDEGLQNLKNDDFILFQQLDMPIIAYSSLELAHKAFQLCYERGVKDDGFYHLLGHLMHAANPVDSEFIPPVTALPMLYLKDFKDHPEIKGANLFYEYLDYAYTRYEECLNKLIHNSCSEKEWSNNIINSLSAIQTCVLIPKDHLLELNVNNYQEYNEHEKIMEESRADLFSVLMSILDEGYESRMLNIKNYILKVAAEQGNLTAKMELNVLHKNKLQLPTYIYDEIKDLM